MLFNNVNAQDCFCEKDLEFFYNEIQNTISYKDQIKGSRKVAFDEAYNQIIKNITCAETEFDCFVLLNKLSYLIDDEHARLRTIPKILSSENYNDKDVIETYRSSDEFLKFPKANISIDSLETALKNISINQIEGIYYKEGFKVGVFKPYNKNYYEAVVLSAPFEIWNRGQLMFRLVLLKENNYKYYHAHLKDKRWLAISNERFINGRLIQLNWKKDTLQTDYYLVNQKTTFEYKKIKNEISYVKLGSFGMQSKNQREAEAFLKELKSKTFEKNLIIDLRNNTGGGDKVSKPFEKLLEREFKYGLIYILVNSKTASNAEIFSQRMRENKNVKIIGHSSAGTLSYGSNYGNRITLPSGKYYFKFTDMNFSKYIDYEGKGIPVDVELNLNQDWINQVVNLIED